MFRLIAVLAFAALAACNNPTAPVVGPLHGTWSYTSPNWGGDIFENCTITNGTLTLSQLGDEVTGQVRGTTECVVNGVFYAVPFGPFSIDCAELDLSGNVAMLGEQPAMTHIGLLRGSTLTGTFQYIDSGITYGGQFVAQKQ